MTIIGIDGCRGGWVVAASQPNLSDLRFAVVQDLCEIFRQAREGHVQVIIDVPIGLSDRKPRIADIEARKVLSRRHKSSVFPAPARSCLAAHDDYGRACQLSREASGKSLSKEGYGHIQALVKRSGFPRTVAAHQSGLATNENFSTCVQVTLNSK